MGLPLKRLWPAPSGALRAVLPPGRRGLRRGSFPSSLQEALQFSSGGTGGHNLPLWAPWRVLVQPFVACGLAPGPSSSPPPTSLGWSSRSSPSSCSASEDSGKGRGNLRPVDGLPADHELGCPTPGGACNSSSSPGVGPHVPTRWWWLEAGWAARGTQSFSIAHWRASPGAPPWPLPRGAISAKNPRTLQGEESQLSLWKAVGGRRLPSARGPGEEPGATERPGPEGCHSSVLAGLPTQVRVQRQTQTGWVARGQGVGVA